MSCTTSLSLAAGAVIPNSARLVARIEKTSSGNGLHDGSTSGEERREAATQRVAQRALSRSETKSAPHWNGPRWSAPFVAQILGQVLPHEDRNNPSVRAAYDAPRVVVPVGTACDRSV
jgi:hypothetical protein